MTSYLVRGADPTLRDREVQRVVDELLAGADRSFALDDHTVAGRRRAGEDDTDTDDEANPDAVELPAFAAIINALSSPPFMTANRVVVVRDIGNLVAEQGKWLAGWLEDPLDGVHLVLVGGGGRTPSALDKAIKAHAEVVGRATDATADVLQRELKDAHLRLAPAAAERVATHLGEDAGRVPELVELWHSAYGDGAVLELNDIDDYLGELGTAGPFELANAIDRGDGPRALEVLHRYLSASSGNEPKAMHPMQVMPKLVFHYLRLLRLDSPAIVTKEQAAEVLGMKNPAGARFPLEASKRLGTDGLRQALGLLAQAELDLRGASGLDERTVMDVLVARLARLSRSSARAR